MAHFVCRFRTADTAINDWLVPGRVRSGKCSGGLRRCVVCGRVMSLNCVDRAGAADCEAAAVTL